MDFPGTKSEKRYYYHGTTRHDSTAFKWPSRVAQCLLLRGSRAQPRLFLNYDDHQKCAGSCWLDGSVDHPPATTPHMLNVRFGIRSGQNLRFHSTASIAFEYKETTRERAPLYETLASCGGFSTEGNPPPADIAAATGS
ncbi:hypothetical protein NXS19_005153 [Fusarium pseudograminearum]|nr:hypothetical protein NXS19_005153 [Fusarium pseudograminearum]